MRVLGQLCEPVACERQPAAVQAVNPQAAVADVRQHAGSLEYLQVTRRRRPRVLEHRRDIAGCHRAALEVERHDDASPDGMCERREERLVRVGHREIFSVETK